LIIAVHIPKEAAQLFERPLIDSAVLFQTVAGAFTKLCDVPASLRHADNRHIQTAAFHHCLERGKDLLVSQITCRAEEDQSVRLRFTHARPFRGGLRTQSAWRTAACFNSPA